MNAGALPYSHVDLVDRDTSRRARKENFVAFAFAVFSAAILTLSLSPPPAASDPSEISALDIVAGP